MLLVDAAAVHWPHDDIYNKIPNNKQRNISSSSLSIKLVQDLNECLIEIMSKLIKVGLVFFFIQLEGMKTAFWLLYLFVSISEICVLKDMFVLSI